jgi:hypothetical protein
MAVVNIPQPVLTPELEPDPLEPPDPPDDPELLPLLEPDPPPEGPFVCPPHAPNIARAISPHQATSMHASRFMTA